MQPMAHHAMLERRAFLRRAAATGGFLAVGGGSGLLAACSDDGGGPSAATTTAGAPPTTVAPMRWDPDRPYWEQGNYAAVEEEVEAFDLAVTGALPPSLAGLYVRNGSNPPSGEQGHWFLGDGMLHGVRLDGGKASWYRNRWVRTPSIEGTVGGVMDAPPGKENNPSNTSVVHHAGKLLSLCEVGWPYEISPEDLSTVGAMGYGGELASPCTAHPKIHPTTGEMHFFGYGFVPPYLTYNVASATGELIHSAVLEVPASVMMHDFNITETHAIFWDQPVLFDLEIAIEGGMPYSWQPDNGARIGVMPLGGTQADLRWIEVEPSYVFHSLNARNVEDDIVIDVCRLPMAFSEQSDLEDSFPHRWTIGTGGADLTFAEEQTSERTMDLPTFDTRFRGSDYRYGWYADTRDTEIAFEFAGVTRLDQTTGEMQTWDPGPAVSAGEGLFVPEEGGGEGEGWILTFAYDRARDGSDLVVLDATDIAAGPVASVALPQRVPYGFHADWMPDA